MDYTDKVRSEIGVTLEGCEPDDVAMVFYDQLQALVANDPDYFAKGRGNSLAHTLELTASLVRGANND